MPEIMPRIRRLGGLLGNFAYILALVYRSARLLPAGHPMLNPVNIGRFGIVDVVSTAANNLIVKRENVDQIMIFAAILMAVVMVAIQAVLILFYALMGVGTAEASTASSNMFTTADPANDLVFSFLQHAIGLENFYNSDAPIGFTSGILRAFHQMLAFYSTAMMVIAVIIVIYYVITVVGESAQSGTPFGRRFNGLWAPVRLILALGLLVPLGSGLNAAQYIALYTAKFGSSLATNAWATFSNELKNTSNFKLPTSPEGLTVVAKNIFLYEVCMAGYNMRNSAEPMTFQIKDDNIEQIYTPSGAEDMGITGTVTESKYVHFTWRVDNATGGRKTSFNCGSLRMDNIATTGGNANYAEVINRSQGAYREAIQQLHNRLEPLAQKFARNAIPMDGNTEYGTLTNSLPTVEEVKTIIQEVDKAMVDQIVGGEEQYAAAILSEINTTDMARNGWGNAATYYLRLAYANQKVQNIINRVVPKVVVQETAGRAMSEKQSEETNWFWQRWFGPQMSTLGDHAKNIEAALDNADKRITKNIPDRIEPDYPGKKYFSSSAEGDNVLVAFIKKAFGIKAMQELYTGTKDGVFPMVLLTHIGTDLIERSVGAFFIGMAASAGGFLPAIGPMLSAIANLIFLFGFIGIGIGFLLAYLLPFMPFIYFFFAVVEWVMSIVEALIGAPLWALAHLRIEGDGMPGQAAMNGYIIMLGILLRPILILFGLIASYFLFNAGGYFLNVTFGGAAMIVQDGVETSPFAFVAYLLIYAVICYNLGLTCFKLIDTIPQQSMRWLGQSNLNFNDGKPDPIGNTQQLIIGAGALAGQQTASAISSGISSSRQEYKGRSDERTRNAKEAQADATAERRHRDIMSKP